MFVSEEIFPREDLGGQSHASTITEGPDGTLYATWYSGTEEKHPDVGIFMSKKSKNGRWAKPWLIEKEGITSENPFLDQADDEEELEEIKSEKTSEGNPVIFADGEQNRLWLFWQTMRDAGRSGGWFTCIVKMKHSDDWGQNWTKPALLRQDIGWGTRNKPIWLSNDELLLPMAASGVTFYRWTKLEFRKGSLDGKVIEPDVFLVGKPSQPSVIQLKTGRLLCFLRTNKESKEVANKIAVTESDDFGHTWSKIHALKEEIPNPDTGLDAVTLENGHVVLVCNPQTEGRQKLTVLLSEDEGLTFPYRRDLEPLEEDKEYHYPAVIQSKDRLIHVTYTNRRLNIKYACFDESWIRNETNTP